MGETENRLQDRRKMIFRASALLLVCAIGVHAYSSGYSSGSSFSSGYNSAASTPTPAPTPAAAKATYKITASVKLAGITKAQFTTAAQTSFKEVVAANTGSICGTSGTAVCTSADVTIISFSRRSGLTVKFEIGVHSSAKATAGAATLTSYVSSPAFATALKAKPGLSGVTGVTVVSAPKASKADGSKIAGASNMAVVTIASVACVLLGFTRQH